MSQNLWDYTVKAVRSAAILTSSYVAGTVLSANGKYNQLIVLWKFTKGSLTTGELKVEFSTDGGTTYYQQTFAAVSGTTSTDSLGEHAVSATGNYRIPIAIGPGETHIKISAKGTGTVTASSATVDAILARH